MTDPTPETPFTVRDRIVAAITVLQGTPTADLAQLVARLEVMGAAWDPGQGLSAYNLLDGIYMQAVDTNNRLDKIQSVLGADPYSSTETGNIRALLMEMVLGQSRFGIIPDYTTAPYTSTNSASYEGKRYIIWPSAQGTLSLGGPPALPMGAILLNSSSWEGYSLYVQSDAPTFGEIGTEDTYPCNSWINLSGTGGKSWFVDAAYQVRGYLRLPGIPTQPVILWQGTNVSGSSPTQFPTASFYFFVSIPSWANRLVLQGSTTNCWGTYIVYGANLAQITTLGGGCSNITVNIGTGWAYVGVNAVAGTVMSGTLRALAPGVAWP